MSTFVSGCLSPESPVAVEASLKLTREAGICFARLWKKKQTENVMFSATSGHWLGFVHRANWLSGRQFLYLKSLDLYYFPRALDPPPRRMWSRAMGPAPKKIKAKASVAAAKGNSIP